MRLQNEQTTQTPMVRTHVARGVIGMVANTWTNRTRRKPSRDLDVMGAIHTDNPVDSGVVCQLHIADEEDTSST
jgi:hypothetical protein